MEATYTLGITINGTSVVIDEPIANRAEALATAEREEARRGTHVWVIPTPEFGEPVGPWV